MANEKSLEERLDALAQDPYYSDNVRNLLSDTLFLISAFRTTDRALKKDTDHKNQRIKELTSKADALQAENDRLSQAIRRLLNHVPDKADY